MRLGILGGSFDPPHLGHLTLARRCRRALALDRVLLVPAYQPPHKLDRELSPFDVRLAMVRALADDREGLEVSTLEKQRGGVSYTVETLRDIRRQRPDASLWLCLGSDSLAEMTSWKAPEEIAALARIAVYHRPGVPEQVPAALRGAVDPVPGPPVAISSTRLRALVAAGQPIERWVTGPVATIIRREGLYGRAPENGSQEGADDR